MRYPVGNGTKEDYVKDWYIASGFGDRRSATYLHDGADINKRTGGDTDLGADIRAIADYNLKYWHISKHINQNAYGVHFVYEISTPFGPRWVHCEHVTDNPEILTKQSGKEGDVIAHIGKTGTTVAHLHFAIYKRDPATFGGIDVVVGDEATLKDWWEDPITFIDQCIAAESEQTYSSIFTQYGYPSDMPAQAVAIVFSKYHEWRDKLQSGDLLTKDEYTLKLKEATEALQRYEIYRKQLSKKLYGVEDAGWEKILEAIPKIIQEADSDKVPAKAAHELFTKVNEQYHNVYVYPEDISKALEAFYDQFIEYKSQVEAIQAQKVQDNKNEVINVTPELAVSFIQKLIEFWRSIWQKSTAK